MARELGALWEKFRTHGPLSGPALQEEIEALAAEGEGPHYLNDAQRHFFRDQVRRSGRPFARSDSLA